MQTIEDIVYSAISHGKRDELYKEVGKIHEEGGSPTELIKVYEEAYRRVVKNVH
jgi:hypothetical protein